MEQLRQPRYYVQVPEPSPITCKTYQEPMTFIAWIFNINSTFVILYLSFHILSMLIRKIIKAIKYLIDRFINK